MYSFDVRNIFLILFAYFIVIKYVQEISRINTAKSFYIWNKLILRQITRYV